MLRGGKTMFTAPPICNNNHSSILLELVTLRKVHYAFVKKRVVTERANIAITDHSKEIWSELMQESDVNRKVNILQEAVGRIYNKHCPIRKGRTPHHRPPITTPLITKLRRAKKRAVQNHNLSWKHLSKLCARKVAQLNIKLVLKNINDVASGNRRWWKAIKTLTGDATERSHRSHMNINSNWMPTSPFPNKLNVYTYRAMITWLSNYQTAK